MAKWLVGLALLLLGTQLAEAQTIWWDSGMVKFRQANSGTLGDPVPEDADSCSVNGCIHGGVVLSAARNEFEPFQIFIAAPAASDASQVNVTVSDLKNAQGNTILSWENDRPKNIMLYREHYLLINAAQLSSTAARPGLWPDALVPKVDEYFGEVRRMPNESAPAFPFNIAADQKQGIWVDVYVPPGTPTGLYTGSAQVTVEGVVQAVIPIQLTVRGFDLPSTPALKTAFGLGIEAVKKGHYGDTAPSDSQSWELICLYTKEMLMHRISNEDLIWPAPKWNSTLEQIDWSLPSISTGCNQRYPEFLSGGDPNLLPNGKLPGAKVTRARLRDGSDLGSKTVEGVAYYQDYIQHFDQMGWKAQLFYYLWDSPPYPSVNGVRRCDKNENGDASTAWQDVYTKAKYFKDNAIDVPLMITVSRQASENCFIDYLKAPDYTRYLDIWTVPNTSMQGKPDNRFPFNTNLRRSYDAIIAPGKELWWYNACGRQGCRGSKVGYPMPMVDLPSIDSRVNEWLTYQYQIGYAAPGPQTEFSFDTVNTYQSTSNDPWKNVYYFTGNGGGTYFYPGRPDKIGGTHPIPIPSIRLKMFREGIEDYEYLIQVEEKKNKEGVDGKGWIKTNILEPYLAAEDPDEGTMQLNTYVWNTNPGSATSNTGLLRAREVLAEILSPRQSTFSNFSLSVPASSAVAAGSTLFATLTVTSEEGFNNPIELSCYTSNPTVGCSYNPPMVTPAINGTASSVLAVTTQRATPAGHYTVTASGSSGSRSHSVAMIVSINQPVPDFQISIGPGPGRN